jgi:hypothetical protein
MYFPTSKVLYAQLLKSYTSFIDLQNITLQTKLGDNEYLFLGIELYANSN